jgi:hypothetical protein
MTGAAVAYRAAAASDGAAHGSQAGRSGRWRQEREQGRSPSSYAASFGKFNPGSNRKLLRFTLPSICGCILKEIMHFTWKS